LRACQLTEYWNGNQFRDGGDRRGQHCQKVGPRERRWEAEVNRTAGKITLLSPEPDGAKAEAHFEQALAVSRQEQAKSFELRAVITLARLRRDQGRRQQAHDLLASVYGWFTEGFDTLDVRKPRRCGTSSGHEQAIGRRSEDLVRVLSGYMDIASDDFET
jgi:hypothetical protein